MIPIIEKENGYLNIKDIYYTCFGWFLWRITRYKIMKTVGKTLKDRRKMRRLLDDKERIKRAVFRYDKRSVMDALALEENRAFLD